MAQRVFRSHVVVAVFAQASQRFASRGVFQFHHVNRTFYRTKHRTWFRQSSGGRLFQLNDVRKENVLFLHQVRRQFCAQCGKGFLNANYFRMLRSVLCSNLGQQLLDTHRLLAHVNVVRRRYVVDQNAQFPLRPVLRRLSFDLGGYTIRNCLSDFLNQHPFFGASRTQGPSSAAAVINSELFENPRRVRILHRQLTYRLFRIHGHTPSMAITLRDVVTSADDFCHSGHTFL